MYQGEAKEEISQAMKEDASEHGSERDNDDVHSALTSNTSQTISEHSASESEWRSSPFGIEEVEETDGETAEGEQRRATESQDRSVTSIGQQSLYHHFTPANTQLYEAQLRAIRTHATLQAQGLGHPEQQEPDHVNHGKDEEKVSRPSTKESDQPGVDDSELRIAFYESQLLSLAEQSVAEIVASQVLPLPATETVQLQNQVEADHFSCFPQPLSSLNNPTSAAFLDSATTSYPLFLDLHRQPVLDADVQQVGSNRAASSHRDLPSMAIRISVDQDRGEETKQLFDNSIPLPKKKKRRRYRHENFPQKLHRLLDEVENAGRGNIVSFTESGAAFRVHNPDIFSSEIAPHYFRLRRYHSFQRQLNLYGFERILNGPEAGAYAHPLFRKGQPDLTAQICRLSELEAKDSLKVQKEEDRKPPAK